MSRKYVHKAGQIYLDLLEKKQGFFYINVKFYDLKNDDVKM